jgi:hypothetical protein
VKRETIFSPCRLYRYTLWREWWQNSLPRPMCRDCADADPLGICSHDGTRCDPTAYLMVIGLNPSTADETKDDPTIRRCIGFAKAWGFGALCMTNLFAWRDTLPENMKRAADPVGPLNDFYLFELAKNAGMILAAWGKHGSHLWRTDYLRDVFGEAGFPLYCLRLNKDGSPEHPLYIPADTSPRIYAPPVLPAAAINAGGAA